MKRTLKVSLLSILIIISLSISSLTIHAAPSTRNGGGDEILLQGFYWGAWDAPGSWYNTMSSKADMIADAGITMIWSPGPWDDDSTNTGGSGYWWHDFGLDSAHGTEGELNNMISTMNAKGIGVIFDIVANHADRFHPDSPWPTHSNIWRANAWEPGYSFSEENELNTGNAYPYIRDAMMVLKNKGAAGWRYDVCHGYPSDRALGWNNDTNASFVVGEYDWSGYNPTSGNLEDWCAATGSTGFDFYEKWNLNSGNPSTFGGLHTNPRAEARARAVTFVENHDSEISRGNGHQAPDDSQGARSKCYAWILATPGTPCIFWSDLIGGGVGYDWLKSMIWVRKNAGIRADSKILYDETNGGTGRAVIVEGTNHNIAIALDWPDWKPSNGNHHAAASGWNGYMNVWTNVGTSGGGNGNGGNGGNEVTKVVAHYDVGYGNSMSIRGDTSPLNWNNGIQMTNSGSDTWVWETTAIPKGQKFECKVLINDSNWATNSNWWVYGGDTIDIYPNFGYGLKPDEQLFMTFGLLSYTNTLTSLSQN